MTTPSLLQVTVVAGPPVEVQVRVVERTLNVKLVMSGEPAQIYKQCSGKLATWVVIAE